MAYKLYGNMRFIPCNDTLENWETENPVLGPGEWGAVIGVNEAGDELDTVERMKVGDGVTPWNDLPWWSGPQGPKGDKGDKGDTGPQGPKGDKGDAGVIKFVVVNSLPDENIENAIYLLPVEGGAAADLFEEYIYIDGRWELLGSAGVEVNLDEYVKNTDYATGDKAGVVKVPKGDTGAGIYINNQGKLVLGNTKNNIVSRTIGRAIRNEDLDFAIKVGLTTNTEAWTEEDKTAARALIGAIGNIDYATTDEAGLVVINRAWGIEATNYAGSGKGALRLVPIENSDIDNRKSNRAISPKNLDYAVKAGLTTNTETLTDEEKAAACEWLGVNALAIPNTIVYGGKSLTVNDVSPLAHKCSLQLVSDTYEEVSNNILDITGNSFSDFFGYVVDEMNGTYNAGVLTYSGIVPNQTTYIYGLSLYLEPGTYTFSARSENENEVPLIITEFDELGIPGEDYSAAGKKQFIITGETQKRIGIRVVLVDNSDNSEPISIDESKVYLQLELGDTMTEWQPSGGETKPYIDNLSRVAVDINGTEYIPEPDGTLANIESVSPTMEITLGGVLAEYANITNFTYLVDTKKYIDSKFEELKAELQGG